MPRLDEWLADPMVRTRHRRTARTDVDRLWHEAATVRVRDAPALGRAVRWRIPGTPAELEFRELFRRYPFALLAEGERWSLSGLCGRLWTIRRDYPRIEAAADFLAWDEPGTVRVLVAHWVEPDGEDGAAVISEARIEPVDRRAGLRLRALWALVGRFERLVGSEALRVAVRRAESHDTEPRAG
jgi:hypothetical protein